MRLGLHQSARMEQRLVQSPQMIQAMQILQLSSLDLEERIEQEMVENPFLEVADESAQDSNAETPGDAPDSNTPEEPAEAAAAEAESELDFDSMVETLERYESDFGDGRARVGSSEEGDRKLEAMRNTASPVRSLADDLIVQLAILDFDERQRELAEFLIYSLDARGYLPDPLEELTVESKATTEELVEVLHELRRVAHPALGAHDLRECLLLQLEGYGYGEELEALIVRDHLDALTTNRLPRIARATGATLEEVKDAIETIRHLDPFPGQGFGEQAVSTITPDVMVELEDGEYAVRLTRTRVPDLQISPSYRKLLEGTTRGDAVQQWVRKRVESARWFIDAMYQRRNTMLRIAEAVFEHQHDFLDRGIPALKPLRMQEVADQAGVHISTVSRAVAGKYAQTPQGIHPIKFFFTSGTAVDTGGVASQASIKQLLVGLVEAENGEKPLSDEELAEELKKHNGIGIARRTVTKYRKALGIPSSSQRKKF